MRLSKGPIRARHRRLRLFIVVGLLAVNSPATAQEAPEPSSSATTTVDRKIPVDHLQVRLRPLTKDELEIQMQGWLDLLRAKIREVGDTELELKALAENESGDKLNEQLVALRTEETALAERARVVLDALKGKGGDVQTSERFINAVSGISKTTDAASYRAALVATLTNWVKRDDGGKLWLKRLIVAAIILLIFWLISKVAGRVTAKALSRHPRASNLLENFARKTTGGIVFVVGILHAINVLNVIASEHPLVLDEPPVAVQVAALADSSVNLLCRSWVKTSDYWTVYWDLTRQVKERFDVEGLSIPYPQRDVHMHHESAPA